MIRFSLAIAAIAVVTTASGLHAQQIFYPGQVIYSQPIYPVAQPVQSYSTYQYIPANEIPPYPIAAPIVRQSPSTAVQPGGTVKKKGVTTKPVARVQSASKTSLPTYRKSNPVKIHPAATTQPANHSLPAVQSISPPVIQYQPAATSFAAPGFFAPQNCFSGR